METNEYIDYLLFFSMFKSYYVVWKQIWLNDKDSSDVGLNRTMQYGNPERMEIWGVLRGSLNRTMQYGNRKIR